MTILGIDQSINRRIKGCLLRPMRSVLANLWAFNGPFQRLPADSLKELGDLVEVLALEVGDFGILGRVADRHQQHGVLVKWPA